MKEAFKNMYQHNLISIGGVRQAVLDGTLTEQEYKDITGDEF